MALKKILKKYNVLFDLFSSYLPTVPTSYSSYSYLQFASKEFEYFNQYYGIQHIFTPPYHPSSNGLAENAVKTLKRIIKKALQEKRDINRALWSFLLYYRNVEHCTTGESPAMLLLGRPIRTRLDVIRPDREGKVRCAQQRQQEAVGGANRTFDKSDTVVEVLGSSNFRVRGSDGGVVHRHIEQLRRRPSECRQSLASAPSVLGEQLDSANAQGSDPEGAGSEEDESEGPTGERAPRVAEPPASQPQPAPASPGGSGHVSAAAALRVRPIRQCRLVKPK
ncbi:uncharacterized protein K02A2.6-like [Papilio machaon]|uniref:uncharacterized protein K02A2.6-like n=1 Tax=Papilio machaon TaxID=76193 RepID=UPI001E664D87|nr:uncharacterized protein K02A2.6-like [Papilio machaon]